MNKFEWRAHMRAKRAAIDMAAHQQKSLQLSKQLAKWLRSCSPGFEELLGYYAINQEPDLTALFLDQYQHSKKIFLPVVRADIAEMDYFAWRPGESLVPNRYKIPEPQRRGLQPELQRQPQKIVVLVPALAIDKDGYRLGYGAGFYDRFLANHPQITTVGVVFSDFVVEHLPNEPHDLPLSWIANEDRVFQVRP